MVIAWGSYAILYNINPDLTSFKSLKVKYIDPQTVPEFLTHGEDGATVVPGKMGKKHGELSGQKWTIPGTSYIVELSKEDVCALENWVKLRMNLKPILLQ